MRRSQNNNIEFRLLETAEGTEAYTMECARPLNSSKTGKCITLLYIKKTSLVFQVKEEKRYGVFTVSEHCTDMWKMRERHDDVVPSSILEAISGRLGTLAANIYGYRRCVQTPDETWRTLSAINRQYASSLIRLNVWNLKDYTTNEETRP